MAPGGTGDARAAAADDQAVADAVRADVEKQAGAAFDVYEAKVVKTQVVAGINYFIKVHVGGGKHVHIKVWSKLDGSKQFSAAQFEKTADDELAYF